MFRRLAMAGLAFASVLVASATFDEASARAPRHAAFVLDANSGTVLHARDADEPRHPASLTKMMTLYLVFETIEAGRLKLSDRVTMSAHAATQAPSKLDLDTGASLSVADAIKALITKSANDVAVALAEKIGGTESNFAKLMTKRARQLGMAKTTFVNASGLPDDRQITTARDMVTLGLHLQDDFPKYYPLFSTTVFKFQGKAYRNHNGLLRTFSGTDGIKTGYTRASGFNLVSSVRRGSRHVVGAVFGGRTAGARNAEMRTLLSKALARASTVKSRKPMFIAKLKQEPKLARRPAPAAAARVAVNEAPQARRVAMAAPRFAPADASPAAQRHTPRPLPPAAAAPSPQQAVSVASGSDNGDPPIQMFKVKPVFVAARDERQPESSAASAAMSPPVSPSVSPADALTALVARTAVAPYADGGADSARDDARIEQASYRVAAAPEPLPETARETTFAKNRAGMARLPSTLGQQLAMLGGERLRQAPGDTPTSTHSAPVVPPPRPVYAEQPAQAGDAPPRQIGRPPSSLQAQAARISAPVQVAALQPRPPAIPAASAVRRGGYEIQIGAYASIGDAQQALKAAQARSKGLLNGYASVTLPVTVSGRQVFRARFAGFDADRASRTCSSLRQRSIDCFVMSAE